MISFSKDKTFISYLLTLSLNFYLLFRERFFKHLWEWGLKLMFLACGRMDEAKSVGMEA